MLKDLTNLYTKKKNLTDKFDLEAFKHVSDFVKKKKQMSATRINDEN
jgi:hypothetical protein